MSDVGEARFEIGRVLGNTFGLIGRNLIPFLLLAILFAGLRGWLLNTDAPLVSSWAPFAASILSLVFAMVLQGALTRAAVDDLSGKGVSFSGALGQGVAHILPLIGLGILAGIAFVIGLALIIVPGLFLIVRWAVAGPAIVVEDLGPTGAMGRSADLSRGHRWAIFGLLVLYAIVAYGGIFGLAFLNNALGWPNATDASFGNFTTLQLAATGIDAALQAVLSLISTVGTAAIYFELRRVKEGVDIEALAATFA